MLQNQLLTWYAQNKRNLPWRLTINPYIIWLSEIILQQTRVQQGLPYFHKFVDKYPTVQKLALASLDEVMKLWQGLGYYSRARNMHATALLIHHKYNDVFPASYEGLLKLKGIGPYTAAAIASFAFNEKVAVLDGNVLRVLSRLFAITEPINAASGKMIFERLAAFFLNLEEPALHNQAMMELGSMLCKPQNPLCGDCPLQQMCLAFLNQAQTQFPVKIKKAEVKIRFFHYFYFLVQQQTAIYQRKNGDVWQNLYDLPLIEFNTEVSMDFMLEELTKRNWIDQVAKECISCALKIKHVLTHQHIFATFWIVKLKNKPHLGDEFIWLKPSTLKRYAVSRLFDKFLIDQKIIK